MENHLKQSVNTSPEYCKWKFLNWLCKLFIVIFKRRKGGDPCVYIPGPIINRPDPCIYDQFLLMELQQPVTWDNPDVALFLNGVEQYTYDLTTNTEYDVEVTVHNSSREKPAIGTNVDIRWIEFGAGAQIRHAISALSVNVPVWPNTVKAITKWRTPATPGHYCIEVQLFHPDDGNPSNNLGWNNTQVKAAQSEVKAPIRIFNRYPNGCPPEEIIKKDRGWLKILLLWGGMGLALGLALFYLQPEWFAGKNELYPILFGYVVGIFAGYAIQGPPIRRQYEKNNKNRIPCNLVEITVDSYEFKDKTGKDADPQIIFAPRPPQWSARVEPHLFQFLNNETYRDVLLIVDAPDAAELPERFNVNAWQGGHPGGGVTIFILTKNLQ